MVPCAYDACRIDHVQLPDSPVMLHRAVAGCRGGFLLRATVEPVSSITYFRLDFSTQFYSALSLSNLTFAVFPQEAMLL